MARWKRACAPVATHRQALMTIVHRPRPHLVAVILCSTDETSHVSKLLEAIAPDQAVTFLVLEETPTDAHSIEDVRARLVGASSMARRVLDKDSAIHPNGIFFVPRERARFWSKGAIQLHPPAEAVRPTFDVHSSGNWERFFASFAGDEGERACVIVFAGASDHPAASEAALSQVAEQGGLVLIQSKTDGPFHRIVDAANANNGVEPVVAVNELAGTLLEHAEPLIAESRPNKTTALYDELEGILPALCETLFEATGHDFSKYKSTSLVRRALRRLHLIRCTSAAEYLARVQSDRTEAIQLFGDLLISVTSFFRDVSAFESLALRVIPQLFANKSADDRIRVWVAGCASGEEAYSIAMLLSEFADGQSNSPQIQIFATDLDADALAAARRGVYSAARMTNVSAERVARFFIRTGKSFKVAKSLREMVLFSEHNLTVDPPFSHLDMVSCRNLLIYLGEELHQRLVPLFHHALAPDGFLFLGPSEALSSQQDLFRTVDAKHRISQRLATSRRVSPWKVGKVAAGHTARTSRSPTGFDSDVFERMQRSLIDEFVPGAVVVNSEGEVIATSANVEEYLTISTGPFINNITRLVKDGLRLPVRSVLRQVVALGASATSSIATLQDGNGGKRVRVTGQPLSDSGQHSDGLFLIVFQTDDDSPHVSASANGDQSDSAALLVERLEVELSATREELYSTVQDLEAANEELKSSNEELISMNEELQSSNEELEASKDELQITNNAISQINNDLANLLTSTRIPTVFLDRDGRLRKITSGATEIFNCDVADVGRSIHNFTHNAVRMPPIPPADEVYATKEPIEDELELKDGRIFVRRALPYCTSEHKADGIVLTFSDVTQSRRYEEALLASEKRLREVIDSMYAFVAVLEPDGTLVETNSAALERGGLARKDVIGVKFWDCGWWNYDEDVSAKLKAALMRAAEGEVVRYDEIARVANDGRATIDLLLQPVMEGGKLRYVIPSGVDVTHRLIVEERLRRQSELTRLITDNATSAIFLLDEDGRCRFSNPAAELMTGYGSDELAGQTLHDLVHARASDGAGVSQGNCAILTSIRKAREVRDHEDIFYQKDGTAFPVICNTNVVMENGKLAGVVMEVRDVTEARRAANEIAETQSRFRELAESIPQLAWMANPDGDIFWFNKRWYDYTGTTLEQMGGWGWEMVHDPDVLPIVVERWRGSITQGVPFDMTFPLRGRDGIFRPFLTRVNPFRDESGAVTLWFGTNTDLSEERAQVETVRRQQRELRAITDNSPDILARFDSDCRFVFVNAAIERATGIPAAAMVGRTNRELDMPEDVIESWESAIGQVFESAEARKIEFSLNIAQTTHHFQGHIVPELGPDGQVDFALAVIRDQTSEVVAHQALSIANRRKDEFLATLAHELRNPLAPVRNGLEILRIQAGEETDTAAIREIMERQIVTMSRLIDDLLDISRISLGKVELRREAVSVGTILDEAIEVSRPQVDAARHQLSVHAIDDSVMVFGDRTRLSQVIGNLIQNSAKYTPDGGNIDLWVVGKDESIEIRVSDNGVGISADMLEGVFEMFTQIARPGARSQGGLGIGLALVRQLVELHDGSVHAESNGLGFGSSFVVRLPRMGVASLPAVTTPLQELMETTSPLRVLVVDDNIDAARSLETVMKLLGHEVSVAFTGNSALDQIFTRAPDVAFVDIGLPDLSGYEVAIKVRENDEFNGVQLVALTGWGNEAHRRQSTQAGFDFHLTKPADTATIRRILNNKAAARL